MMPQSVRPRCFQMRRWDCALSGIAHCQKWQVELIYLSAPHGFAWDKGSAPRHGEGQGVESNHPEQQRIAFGANTSPDEPRKKGEIALLEIASQREATMGATT
jgi:hypothetical protein